MHHHAHVATPEEEGRLMTALSTFEPVAALCADGCGRQVALPGALCIRCANPITSRASRIHEAKKARKKPGK